jgi:hypothetical protein
MLWTDGNNNFAVGDFCPDGWRVATTQEQVAYQSSPDTAALEQAVQAWLDKTAIANGYSSLASCSSYYNSGVTQWATDAKAAVAWRDAVWQACYALFAQYQAGQIVTPDAASLLAQLPQAATYGWVTHAPGA